MSLPVSKRLRAIEFALRPDMPAHSHVCFAANDRLYVQGGVTRDKRVLSDLFEFDFARREWRPVFVPGIVDGVHKHSCVLVDSHHNGGLQRLLAEATGAPPTRLEARGRFGQGGSGSPHNRLTRGAHAGIGRSEAKCFSRFESPSSAANQRVFFFGGKTAAGLSSKRLCVYEFIGGVWVLQLVQPKGNPPPSRYGCGMCLVSKTSDIAVFGGVRRESRAADKEVLDDLFVFSVDTLVWTRMDFGRKEWGRKYCSLAEGTEGDLVLFGGVGEREEGSGDFRVFRHSSANALSVQEKQLYFN